ncbi:MAG: DUF934 domain-containing protein [Variovorax sp.]|nr:MAG: DUF934 domain-containing protein [Variovorax sp.]
MNGQALTTRLPNMLRHRRVDRDATRLFDPAATNPPSAPLPPDEPDWVVPASTWTAHSEALRLRRHPVGIQLSPDDEIAELAEGRAGTRVIDPRGIAFISVLFPVYTDGRGFSLAQVLRNEYRWTGEMRAVGDVLIDTVHYLARCGFDSFVLKAGHDPAQALEALETFSVNYQRSYSKSDR